MKKMQNIHAGEEWACVAVLDASKGAKTARVLVPPKGDRETRPFIETRERVPGCASMRMMRPLESVRVQIVRERMDASGRDRRVWVLVGVYTGAERPDVYMGALPASVARRANARMLG